MQPGMSWGPGNRSADQRSMVAAAPGIPIARSIPKPAVRRHGGWRAAAASRMTKPGGQKKSLGRPAAPMGPVSSPRIFREGFCKGLLRPGLIIALPDIPGENWYNGARNTPGCTTFPKNQETGRNKTRKTRNRTGTVPCSPAGMIGGSPGRVAMASGRRAPYFCKGGCPAPPACCRPPFLAAVRPFPCRAGGPPIKCL